MQPMKTNRSLLTYILLSIVTCGIYELYFLWKMIQDTNEICREDGQNTTGLLLFIVFSLLTCGIYSIIWWYKLAERLHNTGIRNNVETGVSGSTFLLWYIIGMAICGIASFYALYLVINALNLLSADYNARHFGTQESPIL